MTRIALCIPRGPLIVLLSLQTRCLTEFLHSEVQVGQREHGNNEQHNDNEVDHGHSYLHRLLGRLILHGDLNESKIVEPIRVVLIGCIYGDVELTILQCGWLPEVLITVPPSRIILESVKVCDDVWLEAQLDNE